MPAGPYGPVHGVQLHTPPGLQMQFSVGWLSSLQASPSWLQGHPVMGGSKGQG
jgi:hypothetical protein